MCWGSALNYSSFEDIVVVRSILQKFSLADMHLYILGHTNEFYTSGWKRNIKASYRAEFK